MGEKRYITSSDSLALYGLAILLMVFHHLFCIPARLHCDYIPVIVSFDIEARVAWIGKLCVAIFAFISGYASAVKTSQLNETNRWKRFCHDIRISARQMLKLYRKFWLVFILFVPVGIVFFHAPADLQSIVKGILLGQGGYCVEWWYIFQYLKFQCVFPFLELLTYELLDKRNWKTLVISYLLACLAAGVAAGKTTAGTVLRYMMTHGISAYMCIYVTAFLIGRFRIFERIMKLPLTLHLMVVAVCILVRWCYVTDASQSNVDVFITPFLIFGLTGILRSLERTVQLLQFFGRHSTYMWLIHTFWIYYYWQRIVLLPKYSVLIFLWTVLICLINAVLLEIMEGCLDAHIKMRKQRL